MKRQTFQIGEKVYIYIGPSDWREAVVICPDVVRYCGSRKLHYVVIERGQYRLQVPNRRERILNAADYFDGPRAHCEFERVAREKGIAERADQRRANATAIVEGIIDASNHGTPLPRIVDDLLNDSRLIVCEVGKK